MYAKEPENGQLQEHGITGDSFEELAGHAVTKLTELGRHVAVVCGPISTGGTEHQTYNFQIFNAAVHGIAAWGVATFDQTPYEFGLRKLGIAWEAAGNTGYCMPILEVFYARLFDSGLVATGWFIPGWQSSIGARWERRKFQSNGIPIVDLNASHIEHFLRSANYPEEHVRKLIALIPM